MAVCTKKVKIKKDWEISFDHGEKWRLKIFDTAGNKEVRYLLKEELEKKNSNGKSRRRRRKGSTRTESLRHRNRQKTKHMGKSRKKQAFCRKRWILYQMRQKSKNRIKRKEKSRGQRRLIVVLCSLCILMMGKYRIQEKI